EARAGNGPNLDACRFDATRVVAHEKVAPAVGEKQEGRARGLPFVDRYVDPDVVGQHEVERAERLAVACEPDARVETGPADGELELQMRGMGHAPPSQSSQPSVGARSAAKASPVSIETRVIRPRCGARSRTRKVSVAASAPSRDATGASRCAAGRASRASTPCEPTHAAHGRPTTVRTTSSTRVGRSPRTNGRPACRPR